MRTCKCEHWEVCPTCRPEWFDNEGNRLPPEPTPMQKANGRIEELEQQLAEREKQAVLLQESLREQMTLLRGVFHLYIEEHEEFTDENNWTAMACSLEAHHIAKEAFHQPDVQAYSAGKLVELARVVLKQLNLTADADDLRQYILCEKEPVVWMQSDHLSKFIHHACGAQAALVRCSDHQLMPDFQPLYRAKEPKP